MRKLLPMVAVLALAAAATVPAPAQFSLASLSGSSTKLPTTPTLTNATAVKPTLPKYNLSNINQSVLAGQNNPRQFNFAKMLPNFSFLNKRAAPRTGLAQLPSPLLKPASVK